MVRVEEDLCTGCQVCISLAPDSFEMDGFVATATGDEVTPAVEEAAQSCPSGAIKLG